MPMKTRLLCIWLAGLIMFGFTSCAVTSINLNVLVPAEIHVPSEINKLVVINRSLPGKEDKIRNVLEGVLTGEGLFVDRFGSEACINGLIDGLNHSPRFTAMADPKAGATGTGTRRFPQPLDWVTVQRICRENNADALLALEVFDSNNRLAFHNEQRTTRENGKNVTHTVHIARMRCSVESGWRIYYPVNRSIVDANIFNDWQQWSAEGPNQKAAQMGLPRQSNAVTDAGFFAGKQYSRRISPTWINQPRLLYKNGNSDMKYASRLARSNQWKDASAIWNKYTDTRDAKLSGRACFDLALAAEIEGDLQTAIQWTDKAYTRFNNRKALEYRKILEQRLNDQQKLNEQIK